MTAHSFVVASSGRADHQTPFSSFIYTHTISLHRFFSSFFFCLSLTQRNALFCLWYSQLVQSHETYEHILFDRWICVHAPEKLSIISLLARIILQKKFFNKGRDEEEIFVLETFFSLRPQSIRKSTKKKNHDFRYIREIHFLPLSCMKEDGQLQSSPLLPDDSLLRMTCICVIAPHFY